MTAGTKRILDLGKRSPVSEALFETFSKRIVGQPQATQALTDIVEKYQAGLADPTRPIGTALFLGPTGSGKTYTVEAVCEALVGNPKACIKVDCSEYAHGHEIAKLVGSPPGYLRPPRNSSFVNTGSAEPVPHRKMQAQCVVV
jgi:ATP-dependent Clp protease ATP-binding subunit ClpA